MSANETFYREAYTRARIHRLIHGEDNYAPGLIAARLRSLWAARGYVDGWCSQSKDTVDASWDFASTVNARAW